MAATPHNHEPLAGDELTPYEREDQLEDDRCPDCGQPLVSTPNHEWCIRCTQDVASTHPTEKPEEKRLRIENRFWKKVDVIKKDLCWEWQAAIDAGTGYGRFRVGDRVVPAHRVALALDRGLTNPAELPGEVVRHRCDRPKCYNPRHLTHGSQRDNMIDAASRDMDTDLSRRDVREVRNSSATQQELAGRYGVSVSLISMIQRGERYEWVE